MLKKAWLLFINTFSISMSANSGYAMLGVARRNAQAQRVVAERAAMARQLKHLRTQIDAMTRSSVSVRLLRHDLANQVRVVRQLATKGSVEDADGTSPRCRSEPGRLRKVMRCDYRKGGEHPVLSRCPMLHPSSFCTSAEFSEE